MTLERRRLEIELLRRQYQQVEHGPDIDWILFRAFPLTSGWNRESTDLLVLIPPGYPETAPDNFHVQNGLRTESGAVPGNYAEDHWRSSGGRVDRCSVLRTESGAVPYAEDQDHAEDWSPSPDPHDGDSLLTFMVAVERRLLEVN